VIGPGNDLHRAVPEIFGGGLGDGHGPVGGKAVADKVFQLGAAGSEG